MALTQQAPTTATLTCSSNASMSISMRLLVVAMFLVLFSWTLSQAPWTAFAPDLSVSFSALITLSLARLEQEIIGPRDTTRKAQNSLTPSSTWFARKLKAATAFRDFSCATPWVVALVLEWAHSLSQKFVKSTQIALW